MPPCLTHPTGTHGARAAEQVIRQRERRGVPHLLVRLLQEDGAVPEREGDSVHRLRHREKMPPLPALTTSWEGTGVPVVRVGSHIVHGLQPRGGHGLLQWREVARSRAAISTQQTIITQRSADATKSFNPSKTNRFTRFIQYEQCMESDTKLMLV